MVGSDKPQESGNSDRIERRLTLRDIDPDARRLLEAVNLNNFENCLNALEEFLIGFELTDSRMTFDRATHMLDYAIAAFDEIDIDADHLLSERDIDLYSRHVKKEISERFDWLRLNAHTLARANLSGDSEGKLTRRGLEAARDVFRGLSHIQRNFDRIAKSHQSEKPGIVEKDILEYLKLHSAQLHAHEITGLLELIGYLRRLENGKPEDGLQKEDLKTVTPARIWEETFRIE